MDRRIDELGQLSIQSECPDRCELVTPLPQAGAYLGAVGFSESQPPAGTPQIGCVVDAGELQPAGPIVPYQLLTIFGSGLGPATPATRRE